MVAVAIAIVRMVVVGPGSSVAESIVGVKVYGASRSVLYLSVWLEEWRTDDKLSVPG